MNTFTIFIYITGLASKLSVFLVVSLFLFGFSLPLLQRLGGKDWRGEPFWNEHNLAVVKWQKRFAAVWLFLMTLLILVPNRETVLMMVASEGVSRGAQTEIGTELQKTILFQLKELQKDKK